MAEVRNKIQQVQDAMNFFFLLIPNKENLIHRH